MLRSRSFLLERVHARRDAGERLAHTVEVEGVRMRVAARAELGDDVGELPAAGAERARCARQQHAAAAESLSDGDDVEPGRTAAGDDDALAGVHPVLHRDLLDRLDHLLAGKRQHRGRGLVRREFQRHRNLLQHVRRGGDVEPHAPAEEVVRVDIAEHDRGVGDGRLLAALAVAGGAGARARALRADPEQPAGIDPGDRAAAGADAPHIH